MKRESSIPLILIVIGAVLAWLTDNRWFLLLGLPYGIDLIESLFEALTSMVAYKAYQMIREDDPDEDSKIHEYPN